jgi:hypothetical protein
MAIKFLFRSSRELIHLAAFAAAPPRLPAGFATLTGTTAATTAAASATGEAAAARAMSAALYLRAGLVDVQRPASEIKPV